MNELLILFSVGALAGIIAGMLGVGGGIVVVPALVMVFMQQGMDVSVLMHMAIGTSLATIIVTSVSSTFAHNKKKAINWHVFRDMMPGIIIGALLGSVIAKAIGGDFLRSLYIGFIFLVAFQLMRGNSTRPHATLPGRPGMVISATVIGTISSIVGIGGGTMSVPFMTWCNITVRNAVATSSALGIPIAVAGTAGYVYNGWHVSLRPEWSVGYISVPAFIGIVVASILFAPLGARLAHWIPEKTLKRIFAVFLVMIAVRMLFTE